MGEKNQQKADVFFLKIKTELPEKIQLSSAEEGKKLGV